MKTELFLQIAQLNPWLKDKEYPILDLRHYIKRNQAEDLLKKEWDNLWTILVGPRQAGKTTLGKYLCHELITQKRYNHLLYLNCDILLIREWLTTPLFIQEAMKVFKLDKPILFIDEVQRLENPGLLLKAIGDMQLPIKMIASGSSQLEIKSKVQEHLTGRHIESIVLPLSYSEFSKQDYLLSALIYGTYPQITLTYEKNRLLSQLYRDYITKDIVEILRVGKPDVVEKLVSLLAHCSGQLVNYNQLAVDCRVSVPTIQHYLSILEKTYVVAALKPYVGNKRTELTTNPCYYFIDNGFRNQALGNFSPLENRVDAGLLVQSSVFQEILKYKTQTFRDFSIYFWRTKSNAEVDFVLYKNEDTIIPVEVKYRDSQSAKISRGFRSFIKAYDPKIGIYITKSYIGEEQIDGCHVHFIPFDLLKNMFELLKTF